MPPPTHPSDSSADNVPGTVATPEGDNEGSPSDPLLPAGDLQRPRGNEPHPVQPIRDAL